MKPPNHTEWLLWQMGQVLTDLEAVEYPDGYNRRDLLEFSLRLDNLLKKWKAK